jgi:peptidoglycan/LPS O-acetylase OafA/YrhL
MGANGRNFGLDVMRATAILLVVFAHYFASTPLERGGLLGVEVFFVLSGFLIGDILVRSLHEQGATAATVGVFWAKRWFRTLPNYAFFLLCHLAAVLIATAQFPRGWYLYFLFLQNFINPPTGFFRESWSLAVEEWFYLLFPLLVLIFNRGPELRHRMLRAAVLFFLIMPVLLRCYAIRFWDLQSIRMVVPLRLDTMMYGVTAAMIMNWQPALWVRFSSGFVLIPAFAILGAGMMLVRHEFWFSSILAFPLIALGAALFVPWLKNLPRKDHFFPPVIEYISKVSYSTYLLHMPFFFFLEGMISWGHTPVYVKFIGRLLMVTAALLLSYLPYKFIEQPFLGLRHRLLQKNKAAAISAA